VRCHFTGSYVRRALRLLWELHRSQFCRKTWIPAQQCIHHTKFTQADLSPWRHAWVWMPLTLQFRTPCSVGTFNPLTPNGHYCGRTAPLTSRRCILNIYSTNIRTEYFEHAAQSPFFSLRNATLFGYCIIHILNTRCAKT
jgi:hypothetical protein